MGQNSFSVAATEINLLWRIIVMEKKKKKRERPKVDASLTEKYVKHDFTYPKDFMGIRIYYFLNFYWYFLILRKYQISRILISSKAILSTICSLFSLVSSAD